MLLNKIGNFIQLVTQPKKAEMPKKGAEEKQAENIGESNTYSEESWPLKTNFNRTVLVKEVLKAKEKYTYFEQSIIDCEEKIKSFGKSGVPLEYSREDFIKNLNKILENETPKNREKIFGKLKIEPVKSPDSDVVDGYNGMICLGNLNTKDEVENQIYEEGYKFLYQNKVVSGDPETDNVLNILIKGMPEFINIIGKQQHRNHNYSVDVHSLCVLANILKNPDYKELSDEGKFVLKMTAFLHDAGKAENITDPGHPAKSYELSRGIINKYGLNPQLQKRVLTSVKNHQWLQWYNQSGASDDVVESLVNDYTAKEDYTMAKIMAKADLLATSGKINALYGHLVYDDQLTRLKEAADEKFS